MKYPSFNIEKETSLGCHWYEIWAITCVGDSWHIIATAESYQLARKIVAMLRKG